MNRRPTLLPTLQLAGRAVAGIAAPVLVLAGLTLLVIAAFVWCAPAGYAAAGLACMLTAVYVEMWRAPADAGTVVQRVAGTPGPFTPDGP